VNATKAWADAWRDLGHALEGARVAATKATADSGFSRLARMAVHRAADLISPGMSPEEAASRVAQAKLTADIESRAKARSSNIVRFNEQTGKISTVFDDLNDHLRIQSQLFGRSAGEIAVWQKAMAAAGPSVKTLDQLLGHLFEHGMIGKFEADIQAAQKLEGLRMADKLGSPIDNAQKAFKDAQKFLGAAGKGGLIGREAFQQGQALIAAAQLDRPLPPALVRGTMEERSFNVQADREAEQRSRPFLDKLQDAVNVLREQQRILQGIQDQLGPNGEQFQQVIFGP
jgi:hypothetical protein